MKQHTTPCNECPFRRECLPGWLGNNDHTRFAAYALQEVFFPCHTRKGQACAGRATMWSNSCKAPRDKTLLVLPRDTKNVFSNIMEFMKHHKIDPEKVKEVLHG